MVNASVALVAIAETGPKDCEDNDDAKAIPIDSRLIRSIVSFFCFGFLYVIAFRGLLSFLTIYLIEKHAIGLESAAQLLALLQIVGIFGVHCSDDYPM